MGLSGLGDLVLASTGDLSRNRTVGKRLAQSVTIETNLNSGIGRVFWQTGVGFLAGVVNISIWLGIGCFHWKMLGLDRFRTAAWAGMELKIRPPCTIDFKRLMVNPMSTTKSRITGIYVSCTWFW
jgi:NAD-dependent glycerol-3-phosphate dehydrogenase C-terminus